MYFLHLAVALAEKEYLSCLQMFSSFFRWKDQRVQNKWPKAGEKTGFGCIPRLIGDPYYGDPPPGPQPERSSRALVVVWCDILSLVTTGHWWPQYWPDSKTCYVKVVELSTTYQMPFAVYRSDMWFFRSERGPKGEKAPAQNQTFQSPPGIDADDDADDFFGGMAFASAPPGSLLGYRDTGRRIEDRACTFLFFTVLPGFQHLFSCFPEGVHTHFSFFSVLFPIIVSK